MTVEPFPIVARWRRCEAIRDYAMTMEAKERRKYLRKIVKDYVDHLTRIGVLPEKIDRERRDIERLITMPPDNGGAVQPIRQAA